MRYWNTPEGFIPRLFNINKGNIKLINDINANFVSYPDEMEGFIDISSYGDNLNISLSEDFPNSSPITINLQNLQECHFDMGSGILDVESTCPNSNVRLNAGILNSRLRANDIDTLSLNVHTGLLNIHNNDFNILHSHSTYTSHSAELIGSGDFYNQFDLGSGNMNIY